MRDNKYLQYLISYQDSNKMQTWRYPNITPPNREKKIYPRGPSILDQQHPQSRLNKSNFRGFFNMSAIFATIFLFTSPIVSKIQHNYFFQPYLYNTFKQDYFLCIMVWPLFFLWSFTSFILQKLIIWGISNTLANIVQHLTQSGLFLFSSVLILQKNWCSTHCAFVILQACTHFMKMHSYTTVNRDLREQMLQANKSGNKVLSDYPKNITLRNFILFMWTPWLVYDEYPRKQSISIVYIVKKCFIGFTCILMAYIIHTNYILVYIELGTKLPTLQLLFIVMLPSTILIIILFYVTFQNITNVFAEITKLDFREFYEDWWNSTTYEQFNRKWNKPVHIFLYRHLYLQMIVRYKFSKARAQIFTFLFSAALHQFLLAMIFRTIRPIFLFFIIGQVPLIYITKFMEGKKSGNYLYWFGIIIGPSIIITLYLRSDQSVALLFTRKIQSEYEI